MKNAKRVFLSGVTFLTLSLLVSTGMAWGVAHVESRSESLEPGVTPGDSSGLDILRKMEFLQQEVQDLRGKLEEQNYQIKQLQDHQKKLYLDLDNRIKESGNTKISGSGITFDNQEASVGAQPAANQSGIELQGISSSPVSTAPHSTVAPIPTEAEKAAEDKAYQNAYHLIQMKDYDNALLAFKSLVKSFPEGKYLPNAHYWLGEIYFARENLELASNAFEQVYRQFPQHPKAADALLKLGYVEYAKGEWKRSKEHLAQVKNQFPGSTSAQLADARLQRMHREGRL